MTRRIMRECDGLNRLHFNVLQIIKALLHHSVFILVWENSSSSLLDTVNV